MKTHGYDGTPTYFSWGQMKSRCTNVNDKDFSGYGGRGIKVCDRWLQSFEDFLADMGDKPDGMTLERINNDGDYSPDNCRWADRGTQARNRRSNRNITHNGKTQCLSEWAREAGLNFHTLRSRLKDGWSMDKALNTPSRGAVIINGIAKLGAEWDAELGLKSGTIRQWVRRDVNIIDRLTKIGRLPHHLS